MSLIYWRGVDETSDEVVTDQHPLPVKVYDTVEQQIQWGDFESITVSNAVKLLTAAAAAAFTHAFITVETDSVRFRLDFQDPSATVGHNLDPGDTLVLDGRNELDGFRVIRVTTDATLRVSYGNEAM